MSGQVLPPLPPSGLSCVDDLLTDEEKADLRRDLAEMARLRRRAEAESRDIVLGDAVGSAP